MIVGWDIVTIGNISRNRYWGESDDRARRPAICTCTLIRGGDFNLLVDPSLEDPARMAAELDRRTGLSPDRIDVVFITHAHGDHHFGLRHFTQSRWLAAAPVAQTINASGKYDRPIEPAEGSLPEGITCERRRVVIAADVAMNRAFFEDRRGYFNSADMALAAQTIDTLAQSADIIVPGHDNYFLVAPRTATR
jgi:glyoxylase-like metal-dependent hydrolase (beta-lactamase superfamily II)